MLARAGSDILKPRPDMAAAVYKVPEGISGSGYGMMEDEEYRPFSPHTQWQGSTLEELMRSSKRAYRFPERSGRLPTPAYRKGRAHADAWAESKLSDSFGTVEEESESEFSSDEESDAPDNPQLPPMTRTRRQSIRQMQQKTQTFLPDAALILQRLRSGAEGLSDSEIERFTAAFMRFKDPDGPELHKDELPNVLAFLGFPNVDPETCRELADRCAQYQTLEKQDFLSFMEKHMENERQRYQDLFQGFDEDDSGYLDTTELCSFLTSLGFTPLRSMVKEALDLVDLDGNGTLDFEEIVLLMHVYRHSEGFTVEEVQQFTEVFQEVEREAGRGKRTTSGLLPPEKLTDVLLKFFGPNRGAQALQLTAECVSKGEKRDSTGEGNSVPLGLGFQECLVWARRLRDKEFAAYREAFNKFDEDRSDSIDMEELQNVIKTLGFTMTKKVINEIKHDADAKSDLNNFAGGKQPLDESAMDFDSFVHFMQILMKTDGFSKEEMAEIQATFEKFDEDGSGDIDTVELCDMLRYMGYNTSTDQARALQARVDQNGNGALDMREFIRFMRLHREEELDSIRKVFEHYKTLSTGMIEADTVPRAVRARLSEEDHKIGVKQFITGHPLDFDGFIIICDRIRDQRVISLRKRAGFSDAELIQFQDLFDSYDAKKSAVLTTEDCTKLLRTIGFHVRTAEEQQDFKQQLGKARSNAIAAGVEGNKDSSTVNFYVLLQLLRGLYRRHDQECEAKLMQVAEQANFTTGEVSEFQEIFQAYWERENPATTPSALMAKKYLSRTSLYKLLRSMGMRLDASAKEKLDEHVVLFSGCDALDFSGFLLLMRWMMDTNFGNINGSAAQASQNN